MVKRDYAVEIGRLVLLNFGPDAGKVALVLDIVDQNRALIHGPNTGVVRRTEPIRNLSLTPFVAKIGRGARQKSILKALEKDDILGQWKKTSWARKLERQEKRANLNDFQRFQVMIHKKKRNAIIARAVGKLKREQ